MKPGAVKILVFLLLQAIPPGVFAQTTPGDSPRDPGQSVDMSFGLSMGFGVQTLTNQNQVLTQYQYINLSPAFSIGNLVVALDLGLNITPGENGSLTVRLEDWVAENPTQGLALYLSKIRYIGWGNKGDDLFIKLGAISNSSLGTGFTVNNYSNNLFAPEERGFGVGFDLDGQLFDFPYFGLESVIGSLGHPDVMATRLYFRVFGASGIPVLQDLEIGTTAAFDINPGYRVEQFSALGMQSPDQTVRVFGLDLIQPLFSNSFASLDLISEFVIQANKNNNIGGMFGVRGNIVVFIYTLQTRIMGRDFIPEYFDNTYDVYRAEKYNISWGNGELDPRIGWLAELGLNLPGLVFKASVTGPYAALPRDNSPGQSSAQYPHLRMSLDTEPGLLPANFFFSAFYDKKYITSIHDLVEPTDAAIGATLGYQTGPAVISIRYSVSYNPVTGEFETTSGLSCEAALF